jgi:predicted AlkP superfamily phosphohydrolase/phosphomutase
MVCDFLAPSTDAEYTYPPELKDEIREAVGDYVLDVRDFRTADKDRLLATIYEMTEKRFKLARHLLATKPWDLFVMVEMGTDRMHHAFWRYFDREHALFEPGNPYEHAIRDYYIALDRHVGELTALLPTDTLLLVVSDHGAKKMDGAICFNDWLLQEDYLALKQPPDGITPFSPDLVDWSRTRAWGDGGYYGRLFLNVAGREPQGIVPESEVESLKAELTAKLEALGDEHGTPIGTRVFRSEQVYGACNNVPPDLIVYFGDLNWRSIGTMGHPSIWTHENDTGPDDANHSQFGIAIASIIGGPPPVATGSREGMSLYDIAPTILEAFGLQPPPGMGRAALGVTTAASDSVYTPEEEAEIARRLEDLGYL